MYYSIFLAYSNQLNSATILPAVWAKNNGKRSKTTRRTLRKERVSIEYPRLVVRVLHTWSDGCVQCIYPFFLSANENKYTYNHKSNIDLGKVGITSFKSRSFADWQKSGGKNLFPVDPTKVKSASEIPYMQRPGGSPDGADLKGGAKSKGPTFVQFGGKKKAPEPEPVQPKPKNWWTLN